MVTVFYKLTGSPKGPHLAVPIRTVILMCVGHGSSIETFLSKMFRNGNVVRLNLNSLIPPSKTLRYSSLAPAQHRYSLEL